VQQEITMTGTGQHGSVKSGRKAAARPASQRGVVTGELAIKEKKKGGLRASKSSQEKTDGRNKKQKSENWFQVYSSGMHLGLGNL
jgi:hypothetical protein